MPSLHRAPGGSRPSRLATILLAVVAMAAATPAFVPGTSAQAATVPQGMIGLNDWTPPTEATLANASRAGVKRWRAGLFWYMVDKQRPDPATPRDWSEYDRLVGAAARQGVSLTLVLAGCPAWACAHLSGPPTRADAIAAQRDFLREAVLRYGTNGAFWAQNPQLRRLPVTEWQVWNEVNHSEFWKPGPNAADYARFLAAESAVIRAADPRATVVLSGLTDYGQIKIADFLRLLYAQPGFKASFDVLALHAYAPSTAAVARLLDRTRKVMNENGDGARRMWITEMGWGTTSARLRTPTTEEGQATLMRESFDMMIGCRERWNLDRSYWFAYADARPPAGQPDSAGYHTGLFDTAGRAKPAWNTIQRYREGAALPGGATACQIPGTDTRAPQTRIRSRRRLLRTRTAKMVLLASERGARFQCRLVRARSKGGRRIPARWRPCSRRYRTPRLLPGRNRLDVRAVDRAGNADRTPAVARLRLSRSRRMTITARARG